jgi:hypothetical protein
MTILCGLQGYLDSTPPPGAVCEKVVRDVTQNNEMRVINDQILPPPLGLGKGHDLLPEGTIGVTDCEHRLITPL